MGDGAKGLIGYARKRGQENPIAGFDRADLNAHFLITFFRGIFYKQNTSMLHCVKPKL
jgi:hypothetical protein